MDGTEASGLTLHYVAHRLTIWCTVVVIVLFNTQGPCVGGTIAWQAQQKEQPLEPAMRCTHSSFLKEDRYPGFCGRG